MLIMLQKHKKQPLPVIKAERMFPVIVEAILELNSPVHAYNGLMPYSYNEQVSTVQETSLDCGHQTSDDHLTTTALNSCIMTAKTDIEDARADF